jgi:hypothetical protein
MALIAPTSTRPGKTKGSKRRGAEENAAKRESGRAESRSLGRWDVKYACAGDIYDVGDDSQNGPIRKRL